MCCRYVTILVLAALSAIAVVNAKAPTAPMAMKELEGKWQVTRWVDASETAAPDDELKGVTFEFRDDQVLQRRGADDKGRRMKYRLDPTKKPRELDLDAGLGWSQGIYKIDGNELWICVVAGKNGNTPPARPTEFKGSKTGPPTLFVLKQAKAD